MPRESIQITGLVIERSPTNIVTVTVRTPDNSSFEVYQSIDDPMSSMDFIGAQQLLKMKRDAQKIVTDARANPDRTQI